jgi:alanine racemase
MDMIVIDITGVAKAKAGDEVVLIGQQGQEEILASDLASLANTTHYEVVTRLNPLIKKLYL